MVSVRIENVVKRFGSATAVDHINLTINDGEFFSLLGPSGCGKTTLLRMIAGFYDIEEGAIYFGDKLVNGVPAHKRKTGMVFQNYALWPHMTVEKNIGYGLEVQGFGKDEIKKKVGAALEHVRMEKYGGRTPNQLSGGQQQRVALARVLVLNPQVILLDEPLSNLDAKLRLEMRAEMKRIQKESRITTIYVTHDQKEALSMADRMAVISEGKIEQLGNPQEVYNKPANPFVAGFIGETNFIKGKIASIDKDLVTAETPLGKIKSSVFPQKLSVGEGVLLSIRPEAIHVIYNPDWELHENKNIFQMIVADRIYLGEIDQYLLKGEGGMELRALEINVRGKGVNEGRVHVSVSPKDIIVFPL